MKCTAKHTVYQPSSKWRCPMCGATSKEEDGFTVEDIASDASDDCPKLHDNDECYCRKCAKGWWGKEVAKMLQKLDSVMTCPHCKGKGTIPRKTRA